MSPVYNRMLVAHTGANACALAPTISTATASEVSFGNCGGAGSWKRHGVITISGTLKAGQEYLWEQQVNRSGSWVAYDRGASLTGATVTDINIGANGAGASQTDYWQCRVYVVPTGGSSAQACSGPVTSNEISKTANACAA